MGEYFVLHENKRDSFRSPILLLRNFIKNNPNCSNSEPSHTDVAITKVPFDEKWVKMDGSKILRYPHVIDCFIGDWVNENCSGTVVIDCRTVHYDCYISEINDAIKIKLMFW